MTSAAEVLRFLTPDGPGMGLVAVKAVELRLRHMEIMLAHLRLVSVAVLQAVLCRGFYLAVRVVAVKTLQRRHGPSRGVVLVTSEAPVV